MILHNFSLISRRIKKCVEESFIMTLTVGADTIYLSIRRFTP